MIVVDTNILAYLCLPGPGNPRAERLWQTHPVWAAPLLWRSEFRNILATSMRKGLFTLPQALDFVSLAAQSLRGGEHHVRDEQILDLVGRSRCTAYDCEFAALARHLGTVCYTEDKALRLAFPDLCLPLPA